MGWLAGKLFSKGAAGAAISFFPSHAHQGKKICGFGCRFKLWIASHTSKHFIDFRKVGFQFA